MSGEHGIRLHRKQYVFGPEPYQLAPDWVTVELGEQRWLSHCPDLRVSSEVDLDGEQWWLLGLASQTMADRSDPQQSITTTDKNTTISNYESWAGRWCLIGRSEVHLDATGQLPCHWVLDGEGRCWASSSPAAVGLLAKRTIFAGHDLVYERGLSWIVPPLGSISAARRLLPSQILDITTATTRWRRLVVAADDLDLPSDDPEAAMSRFLRALGHGVSRLPSDMPVHLALTAGADSRLVFASLLAADVPVEVFTRRSARMSVADRLIPPRLAAAVGMPHREVIPRRIDRSRVALARVHTAGHVSDGDALPFVQGVRDGFVGIEIGGQGFGAGKVKNRQFPEEIDDPIAVANLVADWFGEQKGSPNRISLSTWLQLVVNHEEKQRQEDRIDWRDRFYLEQRTAGWQAAKEQLYDLHTHHRYFPINSARIFGLLLSIDPELRQDGSHRRRLIEMAEPRLLSEPFNPPGKMFGFRQRATHLLTVDRRGAVRRTARWAAGRAD